jgi:hypothetical protein
MRTSKRIFKLNDDKVLKPVSDAEMKKVINERHYSDDARMKMIY